MNTDVKSPNPVPRGTDPAVKAAWIAFVATLVAALVSALAAFLAGGSAGTASVAATEATAAAETATSIETDTFDFSLSDGDYRDPRIEKSTGDKGHKYYRVKQTFKRPFKETPAIHISMSGFNFNGKEFFELKADHPSPTGFEIVMLVHPNSTLPGVVRAAWIAVKQ